MHDVVEGILNMDGSEPRPHRDLKDRTMQFALAGISFYRSLTKDVEAQVMGRQFLRSVTSVGANTRSAFRGRSKKEFHAKLGVVIEEADECGYWLDLMARSGVSASAEVQRLMKESDELVSIFTSIVKR